MKTLLVALLLTGLALAEIPPMGGPPPSNRYRIKDIARVAGLNSHSLTGYGIVAGLPGTGDSSSALNSPMVINMLNRLGMLASPIVQNGMNRNVAVVAVTGELPAFARSGDRIDVRVASLGDAKSLEGGSLLLSLLQGPDGKVYCSAQGAVGSVASLISKNGVKPAVAGLVSDGGTVSQNLESAALQRDKIIFELHQPDFLTAQRLADALAMAGNPARATGPATVECMLAGTNAVAELAGLGELMVELDRPTRVVCDERSGTVVAGQEVRLQPTVISHRGMTLEVTPMATVASIVEALQKAGAQPSDVIAIMQSLHRAGSLQAELVVR